MNWLKRLFCRHNGGLDFVRNVYGDEINQLNARSIWRCKRCARLVYTSELNRDAALTPPQAPGGEA